MRPYGRILLLHVFWICLYQGFVGVHGKENALSFYALGTVSGDGISSSETHELTKPEMTGNCNPFFDWGLLCALGLRLQIVSILSVAVMLPLRNNAVTSSLHVSSGVRIVEKEKRFGQIYTPQYLVEDILDFAGYLSGKEILEKHIIDNSCGDGAFLSEIVRRYCVAYFAVYGQARKEELSRQLGKFVHGIEIDVASHAQCIKNLNFLAKDFGLPPVDWDVQNADTMTVDRFDGKMDFVVGNPPYVRVHNLDTDFSRVKRYRFCDGGMTDLYLVFYEIGLKMLATHGRLCYIAPSSWINSIAGKNMRQRLRDSGCLRGIIDLQHFQPFNVTTYTAICLLENGIKANKFSYSVYDSPKKIKHIDELNYDDAFFDGALYLGDLSSLRSFRKIKTAQPPSLVEVKNGFATLADDVFIADEFPFADMIIPVIKASTGKWRKAFYPYDKQGKPFTKNTIFSNKRIAEYLAQHKQQLLKGRNELKCSDWHLYGRTQALKDVWVKKYAINTVIRDVSSIKFNVVPEGSGVYSGLYIITDISEESLRKAILNDDFIRYISILKKYKSGGYYTFNSKELKQYLDFKLGEMTLHKHKRVKSVQQTFDIQ